MQRVRRGGTPIKRRDAVALPLTEPRVRDAPSLERLVEQLREQAEGLLALANELQKLVGEQACGTNYPNLYFGDPAALVVFQRQGEYWAVTFTGKTVHLRHRLGFTYLEKLISTPGKSWPCLELIGYALSETRAPSPGLTQRRLGACSTFHRLREQWRSLGEQLEEADRNQDLGRRAALAAQREQLKRYMLEVLRGPHTGAERARVAVHKAIRRALAAVEVEHPGLAAYLRSHVRLGATCSFSPCADAPV